MDVDFVDGLREKYYQVPVEHLDGACWIMTEDHYRRLRSLNYTARSISGVSDANKGFLTHYRSATGELFGIRISIVEEVDSPTIIVAQGDSAEIV